jgi:hypothetical protein
MKTDIYYIVERVLSGLQNRNSGLTTLAFSSFISNPSSSVRMCCCMSC